MKKLLAIGLGVAVVAIGGTAMAATTTVNVSASIAATCAITNTGDLSFGTVDPSMTSNLERTGQVDFWCTKGTVYGVKVDTVSQPINTAISESMSDGGSNTLNYTFTTLTAPGGTGGGKSNGASYQYKATLTPTNVQDAVAANYSGTVTIEIAP